MIVIDYSSRKAIYEQIMERFQNLILKGVLEKNAAMPSVRSLAMELSINPNTIQRAYAELERGGWIYSVRGKGSFVAAGAEVLDSRRAEWDEKLGRLLEDARLIGLSDEDIMSAVKTCLTDREKVSRSQAETSKGETKGEKNV